MPAGPSEVLVLADATCNPVFVAADLLSQAEHGEDSQVILVLLDTSLLDGIGKELTRQLRELPRRAIAEKSLAHSRTIVFPTEENAIDFINEYAPEHLIINTANAEAVAERVTNAGSVFIGNFSPEAVGDYASGTNHTLPTNGYARAYAGVSLESFLKYITFQQLSETGIKNVGPFVEQLAEAEALVGHQRAVTVRLKSLS
jgi:histidinol dehydrogenase